jgi:hypothetical protein
MPKEEKVECGALVTDYKGVAHQCTRTKGHDRFHLDGRDGHWEQWTNKDAEKLAAYHAEKRK